MSEGAPSVPDSSSGPWAALKPYLEKESLAAFFVGISSGFPYAMIGATLTTRLAQDGIDKRTVTAFTLAFLVYNLKVFWAWIVDGVRIPWLGRLGQRVSWLLLAGAAVIAAVINLALVDPSASLQATIIAALLVGVAGATYDIVIDAYRIETLKPYQLGVGSGMSQYGWRIGAAAAGALALVVAARWGWTTAYIVCAAFALPAMLTGLVVGEPARHVVSIEKRGLSAVWSSIIGPFAEFMRRSGAWLVLLFILVHKIGDTLANLTFRLLFNDLGYTNDEIAIYDVGFGFWAFLVGIFVGGILYTRLGLKRSVLIALILMCVSNLSFALLASGRPQQPRAGGGDRLRELRQWLRWRRGGGVLLGIVQPAVHGHAVRAHFRGGERGRAGADGHNRRRADRGDGLRELLSADDRAGVAWHPAVLVHDAPGHDRQRARNGGSEGLGEKVGVTRTIDTERVLCEVDELAERPSRGFRVGESPWPMSGLLVRKGDRIHAYLNRCPHASHPLNLKPDEFLTPDHSLIVCCSHGALFDIDTGYCIDGPCAGQSLVPIPIELIGGYVLLAEGVDPADYQ